MTTSPHTVVAARTAHARNGDLLVFGVNGFLFASWMARIPDVKQTLDLSPGRLSLILLGASVGALIGLPIAGRIAHRLGSAAAVRAGLAVVVPGLVIAAVAAQLRASLWVVAAGLVLVGLGNGIWDVSQNLQGTVIEQSLGRSIMPWFHAAYSGGTVLGALIGALIVHLRVPMLWHLGVVVVLGAILAIWGTSQFLGGGVSEEADTPRETRPAPASRSAWVEGRTLLIGVMVLAAAFTEGTANDWMAVAFVDGHHHSNAVGVLALAVFLVFMTAGRILGTGLLDRFGRVTVLRVLFGAALIGCVLVVFGGPWFSFLGTAVWGLGASLGFPVGISAAADDPTRAPARLSVVTTIGYTAFLAGPPLLGLLGDHFGVLEALLVVGAVSVLALLVVPIARPLPGSSAARTEDAAEAARAGS